MKKESDSAVLKITHVLVSDGAVMETKVNVKFQSAKDYEKFFADWMELVEKYKKLIEKHKGV